MTVAMTGPHRRRFGAAMDEFRHRRGAEPDRAWRALLLLTTATPGFWERVREHVDWEKMQFDPAAIPVASFDETRLLRVAVNLLHGQGAIVAQGAGDGAGAAMDFPDVGPGQKAGPEAPGNLEGMGEAAPIIGVDVRDMADNMDGTLWRVVVRAWEEYQKRG